MLGDLQPFFNYRNTVQSAPVGFDQKNQSTSYIKDGMVDEISNDEESFFRKNSKFFILQKNIIPNRNLAFFKLILMDRPKNILTQTFELFKQDLYDMYQIKVYFDNKGCFNFTFHLFLNQNSSIKALKLLEDKKKVIFDTINKHEMKVTNIFGQSNIVKQNIASTKQLMEPIQSVQCLDVKLYKVLNIVKHNQEKKRILYQVQGSNNLCQDIYNKLIELDESSYLLIKNGELFKLEKQITTLLCSLDIAIQETVRNLLLTIYLENGKQRHFQFNQLQLLSEFFNRQLQQNETFQIRIQLLIQVLCIYLLKIYLNLDEGFPQKDVILINSRKQIKLDMLAHLKCSQCRTNQLEQPDQMEEILNYFELLLPYREKPIVLDNHNITNELQNMKQRIKQNKITVNLLIQQLIQIEKLIKQYNRL